MIYQSRVLLILTASLLLWVSPLHGVERSCLLLATSILAPNTISPEVKTDELVQNIIAAAHTPTSLGTDPSSLLAEAARMDIKRRSQVFTSMLANRKSDQEIRRFNTIIAGAGPTGAVLSANLDGTRTMVVNSDEFMGTFSRFGDTFYVNSPERPGQPSPNLMTINQRASVQVPDVASRTFNSARVFGNVTEINLAMSQADFLLNDTITKAVYRRDGLFDVTTLSGKTFVTDVIVAGTGLGASKFPFRDESTLKLIGEEYAAGLPKIRFIDHFMTQNNVAANHGINPIHRYTGKRVLVIGKGDGGAIASEYLLGLAPPEGYAGKMHEVTDSALPASVIWLGPEWKTADEYKQGSRERYWDLAPMISSGRLTARTGHATRIEKITRGPDSGAYRIHYGESGESVVADEIVVSAGYDNTVAPAIFGPMAPGGDYTKLVTQLVKSADGKTNIARQVVINGTPVNAFIAGPSTGGLETFDEPGGEKSPRIQVMGWRNAALAAKIRQIIGTPRRCVTCAGTPPTVLETQPGNLIVRSYLNAGLASIRTTSESERETRIRFHLGMIVDSLYPARAYPQIEFTIEAFQNNWIVSSYTMTQSSLQKVKALIDADQDLLTLIRTQPGAKARRNVRVRYEPANPMSLTSSVTFF